MRKGVRERERAGVRERRLAFLVRWVYMDPLGIAEASWNCLWLKITRLVIKFVLCAVKRGFAPRRI